jgi:hypothetical protein
LETCSVRGCDQQTLGKSVCYFHRKQLDGLIPKRDRIFYLRRRDEQLLGNTSKLTKRQHKLFKSFFSDAKLIAHSFSSFSAQTQMNYAEYLQECLVKLWELIIYNEIDLQRNYKAFVCRRLYSACANRTQEAITWNNRKLLLQKQHWVLDLEEAFIQAQHQLRVDNLLEMVRTTPMEAVDRAILNHNLYPMSHEIKSLRLIAKEFGLTPGAISKRAIKLLTKLRTNFHSRGETSYWN